MNLFENLQLMKESEYNRLNMNNILNNIKAFAIQAGLTQDSIDDLLSINSKEEFKSSHTSEWFFTSIAENLDDNVSFEELCNWILQDKNFKTVINYLHEIINNL